MVELKGSLSGIGLVAIAELINEVHHSGNLQLTKGSLHGTLAFNDGRLVAAECGEHHGLQGVADCVLQLADGEFAFVEGAPTLEHTLDFGPSEFKSLVERISSGEFKALAHGVNGSTSPAHVVAQDTCPVLGFADDPSHHYSRATALHRCYASGAPSLVSSQEQHDLCLSGNFETCPRFRSADWSQLHSVPLFTAPPPVAPPSVTRPEISNGVAAEVASVGEVHPAAASVGAVEAAAKPATLHQAPPLREPEAEPTEAPSRRYGVTLILGGALAGFVLVGLFLLVVLPALRPAPQPIASSALQGVRQPTLPPVVATPQPAGAVALSALPSRPTLLPTPTPLTSLTQALQPTSVPPGVAGGRTLTDVHFASGLADGWVNNPPYAAWIDGAFRFQAHDAARFVAVGVPINRVLSDVVVSATFRKTGGPPGGGYGLIVRDQGPAPRDGVNQQMTAYVVEAGDLGEYGVWRRDGDHWVDLVPWTRSTSVRSGGSPNDLSVRAVGEQLTFTVNDANVAIVQDSALAAGGVGVFVGGDNNEVALDHFSVQLPN